MILNVAERMHARRNPGLTVTSTAYSQLSPATITSGNFLSPRTPAHRHLLSPSPPASPGLPSLVPRHGKKPSPASHTRLVKRLLVAFCGVTILVWLAVHHLYTDRTSPANPSNVYGDDGEYEMVEEPLLPQEPSALIIQDGKGNSKWTVSIPSQHDFPLKPAQYAEICKQSMELSKHLREAAMTNPITKRMLRYYTKDKYFMDIAEAEAEGLLPPSPPDARPDVLVGGDPVIGPNFNSEEGMMVCDKSLTYVMETSDAGFGHTLMGLWMSYGLAMKEGRAFFVDDTRWPYGKYTTYFTPPPSAGCLPPPKSHMLPCPHTARHIIVSAATTPSTFGHAFTEEYEDPRKMEVQRQHNIFAFMRAGYEALFKLNGDDAKYVIERNEALYKPITEAGGMSIAMHVRRGDRHPFEYQFKKDYLPLDRYVETAREIFQRSENATKHKRSTDQPIEDRHTASKMIVASDDPDVYGDPEMGQAIRAQDRIILASKTTLEAAQPKKNNHWIDEISGWEGGFFRDVFWSLGRPQTNANGDVALNKEPAEAVPESVMRLRELVGRAYLMDLAVVGKADAIVCTVSSAGCRMLAVMMGWERAIDGKRWVNVDGDFDWKGIIW